MTEDMRCEAMRLSTSKLRLARLVDLMILTCYYWRPDPLPMRNCYGACALGVKGRCCPTRWSSWCDQSKEDFELRPAWTYEDGKYREVDVGAYADM